MPYLRIPASEVPVLRKLATLDDDVFEKFCRAIDGMRPTPKAEELAEQLHASVSEISAGDAEDIVSSLLGMVSAVYSRGATVEKFATDLLAGLCRVSISGEGGFGGEAGQKLKERINRLLSAASLRLIGKISDIGTDYPCSFDSARVLTDIRPLFEADSSEEMAGALIAHTLKVTYHGDNGFSDFYVALNGDDLDKLIAVLTRAKAKASAVRQSILVKSGVDEVDY